MNHLTESQLNLFLDAALSPTEHTHVAHHLATCSECRAQLQALRSVFTLLQELADRRLDRDLSQAVLAELAASKSSPFGWTLALAVQAGVALGVLITLSQAAAISSWNAGANWDAVWHQALQASAKIISTIYSLTLPTVSLPGFSLPHFALPTNAAEIGLLAVAAALLWIVGNASLLRSRAERRR